VGLDLAWSEGNTSGAVALDWDGCSAFVGGSVLLKSNEEVVSFVGEQLGPPAVVVAVDAPLVVPNLEGTRPGDRELSRVYRRFGAGAYPANRRRFRGKVRGEELVRKLIELGFTSGPHVGRQAHGRRVVEVYPHPALVELFQLPRTLQYKARQGRSYEHRWAELERLIGLLRGLEQGKPPLQAGAWLDLHDPRGLRGRGLKALEDLLDGLLCAYIALHLWYWGPPGYRCFGDSERGYILVPVQPSRARGRPAGRR